MQRCLSEIFRYPVMTVKRIVETLLTAVLPEVYNVIRFERGHMP